MLLTRLSFLFLFCLLGGCEQEKNPEDFGEIIYEIPEIPANEDPSTRMPAKENQKDTLEGLVLRKGWTKSYESWNAGGSEYFVLDVGDAAIKERSAIEGVILRPSQQTPSDAFAKLTGKRVKVVGTFVSGKPYVPADGEEQYPIADAGGPQSRGSGFVVSEIKVLRHLKRRTRHKADFLPIRAIAAHRETLR